jgi:hypothetical protein
MAIWNILQTFMIFYDNLVHFVLIWYIFPVLVSYTKKSGNPDHDRNAPVQTSSTKPDSPAAVALLTSIASASAASSSTDVL